MARELTERQQKFLAVLMDEAGGDVTMAKKLAGTLRILLTLRLQIVLKKKLLT